ncbi:hypothetical protein GNY06_04620 [Elizabethkingia argentiflava]|uniref:Uncharacterized protein n=1 Tax=Elizabethkingia argenteiflava TaxID=2681556 RepID=A0A845PWK5_9FLAO|nr:hypothetical protein [Elizabethkingia argenteiflava]
MMKKLEKQEYVPPEWDVLLLSMEQGIAAQSAIVEPPKTNNQEVREEWGNDDNVNQQMDW